MAYCDTNILTAFVNRDDLRKNFGEEGVDRFRDIKGFKVKDSGDKLKKVDKCVIDRDTLLDDIGMHEASMGAILTSKNLKQIEIKEINGQKEGENVYNRACKKFDKNSRFYKNFCKDRKLKNNLSKSNQNDVRHFGSAIKSNSKRFITSNKKDFKPLKQFTKVEVV